MLESLLTKLSLLKQPTLLIRGQYDPVCGEDQMQAFVDQVANGRLELFEHSSHFARFEEANRYAQTVIDFLLKHHA